ncbi:glycoside hydrolase family 76 protein [Paraflavitalea sp. CAU 1676]|uniref:glycoside hydrolase family 76 protein n=1 Tax=Paraflavitalea sp. CAU 1676 TaxID=3032598 RepID=UPI0023DCBD6E|nr:glycoside hydrolase family 76 protein [Paraflavitalea sp. CAU 1676]MDF2192581.1 glycoside hydrolase family 76 protein [Paraflavitalea sp. CAU 1676]
MQSTYTLLLAGAVLLTACEKKDRYPDKPNTQPEEKPFVYDFVQSADKAQQALNTQFWSVNEQYYNQNNDGHTGFNYWWNAHALDVLVDGYVRTNDAAYVTKMNALYDGMYKKNGNKWTNNFYDDMEWMALACLRAYAATNDAKFKTLAESLWTTIKGGWTTVNGGGIMWEKNSPASKNACSNGPAIILAVRLYKLNGKQDDLDWAKKIYTWQRANLVEAARGIVWDGFGNFNEGMVLTYNQGTWLGGALELYTITNDEQMRKDAIRTANYIMNDPVKFSPKGILKGENTGDGGLFKGIFIRYFVQLIQLGKLDDYARGQYLQYLQRNGESLVRYATLQPDNVFQPNWNALPTTNKLDCSVQLSGLMLLEAINELKRAGILK